VLLLRNALISSALLIFHRPGGGDEILAKYSLLAAYTAEATFGVAIPGTKCRRSSILRRGGHAGNAKTGIFALLAFLQSLA